MVKPLRRLFPSSWKAGEAHAEGRGSNPAGNWVLSGGTASRGPRTGSHSRWGTESTRQMREGGCRKRVYQPPIRSLPFVWLCRLEGKPALGHRGDCNCFKVPVKGNCVTTCLISPGCKMIQNHRKLFPSAGAAGSRRPLCFIYKPVYWGGTKWPEKFSMNGDVALSYSLFPDSSVSILTKAEVGFFFPESFSYQKMWFQVRAIFAARQERHGHRDGRFSIFQGDEMKQKENLPPLELWSKIKLFCFKTFIRDEKSCSHQLCCCFFNLC